MSKAQILFVCSEEFKAAFTTYAQDNKTTVSELIRSTLAAKIGYDLSKEPAIIDGRRKYANAEERKEEQKRRSREQRQAVTKLVEAFGRESRLADIEAIEQSLLRKGIDPNA